MTLGGSLLPYWCHNVHITVDASLCDAGELHATLRPASPSSSPSDRTRAAAPPRGTRQPATIAPRDLGSPGTTRQPGPGEPGDHPASALASAPATQQGPTHAFDCVAGPQFHDRWLRATSCSIGTRRRALGQLPEGLLPPESPGRFSVSSSAPPRLVAAARRAATPMRRGQRDAARSSPRRIAASCEYGDPSFARSCSNTAVASASLPPSISWRACASVKASRSTSEPADLAAAA